ncbi:hypothetical protein CRI94_11705 [Longibacter salinarum]|uniref:Uncharacterized protein n=1 Tax=Longibacter salinarum TaxID=1850348 RepID=A0A2A8CXB8_9BACT|nr:hypothetical protein CRI94_11705 [Longibacter salinarum]
MGVYLSIYRLPIEPALDILTLRRWFEYIDLDRPAFRNRAYRFRLWILLTRTAILRDPFVSGRRIERFI